MTIENGLAALEARADGRSRRQPPPRHPKRSVEVPPATVAKAESTSRPAGDAVRAEVVDLRQELTRVMPKADLGALRPTQVHLDATNQDFLRRCGAAGLLEGSRDVTMSGVIRFALTKLASSKSPEEVAQAMLAGDGALRRPGRRRL